MSAQHNDFVKQPERVFWHPVTSHDFRPDHPIVDELDGNIRKRTTFKPIQVIADGWEVRKSREHADCATPWTDTFFWYRRQVSVSPEVHNGSGASLYLVFGGVDDSAWIYVNDVLVAVRHIDDASVWQEPFAVDVTGKLRAGGENTLAVRVRWRQLGEASYVWKPVVLATVDRCDFEPAVQVAVKDDWTLDLQMHLDDDNPPLTGVRTTITQPRGYRETISSQLTVQDAVAQWQVPYTLSDEASYERYEWRADWRASYYVLHVELLAGPEVVHHGSGWFSTTRFMPHSSRGVPLVGLYSQHLVECAPERCVYIDADDVSVMVRGIKDRLSSCQATMDVVEPGQSKPLSGPWDLEITEHDRSQRFSTTGWARGEYWVRLRLHQDGRPLGAYMVRSFWKEYLPPEQSPPLIRPMSSFEPAISHEAFSEVQNIQFAQDVMEPKPDAPLVTGQMPWESIRMGPRGVIRVNDQTGQYEQDYFVTEPAGVDASQLVCRVVSDDGENWHRPDLGLVECNGSSANNIVSASDTKLLQADIGHQVTAYWSVRDYMTKRIQADPDLLPDRDQSCLRDYDLEQDGPVNPSQCFVMYICQVLKFCKNVTPELRACFREPQESARMRAFAFEKRGQTILMLSREPLVSAGAGMDLHHSTETFRLILEDRSSGTHYFFIRPGAHPYRPHYAPIDNIHQTRRVLAVIWTKDFLNWQRRFVLSPDENDPDGAQFYMIDIHQIVDEATQGSPGSILHEAVSVEGGGRVYLGSLGHWDAKSSYILPQLIWTRDFIHWYRLPRRKSMIRQGLPGSAGVPPAYNHGGIRPTDVFVPVKDNWYLSYCAYRTPYKHNAPPASLYDLIRTRGRYAYSKHFRNWPQFHKLLNEFTITPAVAACTAGRLCHAEPQDHSTCGELTTVKLDLHGEPLVINAAVEAEGCIRAELCDEQGKVMDGFSRDACEPFDGDEVGQIVQWNGKDSTAAPSQQVLVRFILDRAKLFSFGSLHTAQTRWQQLCTTD